MENQEPAEDPAIANISTLKMTDNHMLESIFASQQVNMDKEIIVNSKNDLEIVNESINSVLNPQNEKKEDTVLDNDNLLKGKSDNALSNVIPSTEDTVCEVNNSNEKKISIANSEDMHVMLDESDNINENQSFTIGMNIFDDEENEEDEIKQDYLEFGDTDSFEVSNESNLKEYPYSCDLDECNLNSGQINHEFLLTRGDVPKNVEFFSSDETDCFQNDDKLLSSLAPSSPPNSQKSCSPDSPRSCDSTLDENETAPSVLKKNFSMPYFWLPNPDLEDFFVETEKKLQVPEVTTSTSSFTRKQFEPKDTGDIVFTIEEGAVKNNSEIFSDTSEELPQKMSEWKDTSDIVFTIEGDALKSNSETSRNSSSNDYRNLLASIDKLDDSKSPGIKRLALKEYLKKKIEEKKLLSFQRSRENAKLDEEMEEEYKENVHSESSTEDEFEEEIVSFDKQGEKPCKLLDEESDSQELSNDFHCAKNDESDDDVCPRKAKRVPVLEDDSSDELDIIVGDKWDDDSNLLAVTSCDSKTYGEIENSEDIIDKKRNDIDEDLNMSADLLLGLSKARVFSNCSDVDYFQDFSLKPYGNDYYEGLTMGISPSLSPSPSYQLDTDFCNEEEFDVSPSEMMEPLQKNWDLKSEKENSSNSINSDLNMELNVSLIEDKSPYNSTPNFGLTLDDPPISESENVSDMFSSQDLVNLCSGVFKSDKLHKSEFGIDTKEYFDEEPGENCTKMDDLPQEKVQDYFDNEAELSGDDDGLDDDQEVGYDDDENELFAADEHELPAEEELRDEIADLHMKQIRDDDDELLKEIQEKFLDDGELNNDGKGRIRKYAWKDNDIGDTYGKNRESSSESDSEESLDETWSSMCREKAKWRQENEKEDDLSEMCPSYKKPLLKINIIGKSEFSKSPECLSNKRPRGSFLHLDDNAASRVLKKLKVSEDTYGGSRSTKHFLFLNDPSEDMAAKGASGEASKAVKGASGNLGSKAVKGASGTSKAGEGASGASKAGEGASDDLASDNTSGCGSVFDKI